MVLLLPAQKRTGTDDGFHGRASDCGIKRICRQMLCTYKCKCNETQAHIAMSDRNLAPEQLEQIQRTVQRTPVKSDKVELSGRIERDLALRRAPGYEPGGRGFESLRAHQFIKHL